jgi:hypothetical protein
MRGFVAHPLTCRLMRCLAGALQLATQEPAEDTKRGSAGLSATAAEMIDQPWIGERSRLRAQRNYSERRLLDVGRGSVLTGI